MTRIYTRGGDDGSTSVPGGGRESKTGVRFHVAGTLDELNSMLGLARALGLPAEVDAMVARVQSLVLLLGTDLATPLDVDAAWVKRVDEEAVSALEREIDEIEGGLRPLRGFILPGGCPGGAALHVARTICRRAERWTVALSESEGVNPVAVSFLNRLSDWLFVVARLANHISGTEEGLWGG